MRKLNEKYLPKDEGQTTWLLWQHTIDLMANYIEDRLRNENKLTYEKFVVLLLTNSIGKEANATLMSNMLGRNPNTLSTILDRMEKDGLVKKTRDTIDRRMVYVAMTEKGKKVLKTSIVTGNKLVEKFTDTFTEDDRESIYRLVNKLDKVITNDVAERNAKKQKQPRVNLD